MAYRRCEDLEGDRRHISPNPRRPPSYLAIIVSAAMREGVAAESNADAAPVVCRPWT